MNNMPMWPMNPNMGNPNMGGNWGGNFGPGPNINERINNLENQINRLERQIRRMDNRINRLENTVFSPQPYGSQNTGFGSNNDKYMM